MLYGEYGIMNMILGTLSPCEHGGGDLYNSSSGRRAWWCRNSTVGGVPTLLYHTRSTCITCIFEKNQNNVEEISRIFFFSPYYTKKVQQF